MLVFGFGSLINTKSLKATVPDAYDIKPAYIKSCVRDFSLWDLAGFTDTNLDIAGKPFCAVDIKDDPDKLARVNGITFNIDEAALEKLKTREHDYELTRMTAYGYNNSKVVGDCLVFFANKNNGTFDFNSVAQMRYLEICLKGAKEYGEQFYKEFINTTFIGSQKLSEVAELET